MVMSPTKLQLDILPSKLNKVEEYLEWSEHMLHAFVQYEIMYLIDDHEMLLKWISEISNEDEDEMRIRDGSCFERRCQISSKE